MHRKITISGFQFFCLIFLIMVGTIPSEIYLIAKQDGWISLIIGLVIGCILFYMYIKLYNIFPDKPFIKYSQHILGKYSGNLVALVYIVYFIYIAARLLRDFEELMKMALYEASSLISLGILMMVLVIYSLYKGFETIARACEFIFVVAMFLILLFIGFEIFAKIIHINNLRPVLENGWKPIFNAAFPLLVTSPFGEIFILTMIMPYLKKQEVTIKIGMFSLVFSGFMLIVLSILNIAILGVSTIERAMYPLRAAVTFINIADFVQRLDTFIVIISVLSAFVKITVYFYCAVSGAADLFGVKKSEQLVYPIAIIIVLSSIWMAPNYLDHLREGGKIVPYFLHIPLQCIIPIILLIVALILRKQKVNILMK